MTNVLRNYSQNGKKKLASTFGTFIILHSAYSNFLGVLFTKGLAVNRSKRAFTNNKRITVRLFNLLFILFLCYCANCSTTQVSKQEQPSALKIPLTLRVFNNPIRVLQNPKEEIKTRRMAAFQIIEENLIGAEAVLLEACQNEPKLVNLDIVNFFGEKFYYSAIPLLKKVLQDNKDPDFIYASTISLLQMQDAATNDYILHYCKSERSDKRYSCLLAVYDFLSVYEYDTGKRSIKGNAVIIFDKILQNQKTEENKIVELAKNFFKTVKLERNLISKISKSNRKQLAAKEKWGTKNQVFPTYKANAKKQLSKTSKAKTNKKATRRKLPSSKKRSYSAKLVTILEKQTKSRKKASQIVTNIDQRLKYQSKLNDDISRFIIRAYQDYYKRENLNTNKVRALMQKGLKLSGSLPAVLRRIRQQYKEDPIRFYTLSVLFKISRLQAKLILSLPQHI